MTNKTKEQIRVIRDLKGKVNSKLKGNSGESITETLVALLIASLALVMLAATINAVSNMVLRTRDKLKNYYAANEYVINMDKDAEVDSKIAEKDELGVITIKEGNNTLNVGVTTFTNKVFSNKQVMSYRVNSGN